MHIILCLYYYSSSHNMDSHMLLLINPHMMQEFLIVSPHLELGILLLLVHQ